MRVTAQIGGETPRAFRVALAASAAFATVLVTGCEREMDQDVPSKDNHAQLPYQLAVALPDPGPALPVRAPELVKAASRPVAPIALAAPTDLPAMPAPTMVPPMTFVPSEPLPAAPTPLPSPLEQKNETPSLLAVLSPAPDASGASTEPASELSPTIPDAEPLLAAADQAFADRQVYIPQVTESVRAAYVAQVDAAAPGQRLAVRAGDTVLGEVQFQVADGVISVNIGQVLDLFEGRFDAGRFAQLRGSDAAQSFVSLDQVQAAGIPLEYSAAYDELILSAQLG